MEIMAAYLSAQELVAEWREWRHDDELVQRSHGLY